MNPHVAKAQRMQDFGDADGGDGLRGTRKVASATKLAQGNVESCPGACSEVTTTGMKEAWHQ